MKGTDVLVELSTSIPVMSNEAAEVVDDVLVRLYGANPGTSGVQFWPAAGAKLQSAVPSTPASRI